MAETLIIENQRWLKVGLVLGLLGFLFGSGFGVFEAARSSAVGEQLVMGAVSVAFLMVVRIGWKLVPYLNHRLELLDSGIRISDGTKVSSVPWSSLAFRMNGISQVVELFDASGQRIYAVDYLAQNASQLLRRLHELDDAADRSKGSE